MYRRSLEKFDDLQHSSLRITSEEPISTYTGYEQKNIAGGGGSIREMSIRLLLKHWSLNLIIMGCTRRNKDRIYPQVRSLQLLLKIFIE